MANWYCFERPPEEPDGLESSSKAGEVDGNKENRPHSETFHVRIGAGHREMEVINQAFEMPLAPVDILIAGSSDLYLWDLV